MWPTVTVVLAATVTDIRSRRIPNWLVAPFLGAGLFMSAYLHGWSGIQQSLLGIGTAIAILGIFCYLGGMGMGDLKLCAAVGAWVGPMQLIAVLVMMAIVGAVMAIAWAIMGGFLSQTMGGMVSLLSGFWRRGVRPHATLTLDNPLTRKIPYAPAIAIGTILSFIGAH
jgi:prepilin peptidase CpaA